MLPMKELIDVLVLNYRAMFWALGKVRRKNFFIAFGWRTGKVP